MPDLHHQRPQHRRRKLALLLLLLTVAFAGCAAPRSQPAPPGRAAATAPTEALASSDVCPQRLHDLSGGLLLYYFQSRKLPGNLSALELPGGITGAAEALIC